MKQVFLVAVLLAALPLATPLRAGPAWQAFPLPSKVPDGYLQMIEPVAPGVHVVRQGDPVQVSVIGNIVVIEQGDGLVLFDAADSPGNGRRAVELIRRVSGKPVKAVVLSHWHSDHHFGLPAIVAAWPGARIIAHRATADHIATRIAGVPVGAPTVEYDAEAAAGGAAAAAPYRQRAREPDMSEVERRGYEALAGLIEATAADGVGQYIVLPTETFADRLVLDDPAIPIEALFLGAGNTDGDVVLWLPRQGVLATGDLVVSPIPYGINVYPTSWRYVLEKLEAFDFAVLVPGHGMPQRDKTYLRDLQAAMDEVTAQVTALADEKLDLDAIRKRLSLAAQTDHFVGSDPWARRWFARYWYAPYAGCVYREIKDLDLVQGVGGSANCTTAGSLGP